MANNSKIRMGEAVLEEWPPWPLRERGLCLCTQARVREEEESTCEEAGRSVQEERQI